MYSILLKTSINLRNLCIKGCFESKTMNLLIIDPIASAIWSFEIYRGFFFYIKPILTAIINVIIVTLEKKCKF